LLDLGQAVSSVVVRTGEDDPDHPRAVGVGGGLEEDIDRRPCKPDALVDGERERVALDEQVVVLRRDIDVPRLDRHLVLDIEHRSGCPQAQQLCERCFLRVGMAVLRNRNREVELGGQVGEHAPDGLQSAPGSADADQVVHQPIFR